MVRYDPTDDQEYVYVVYTCYEPYPTHPRPLSIIESQFSSVDTIPEPINIVVERLDHGGVDDYGHAMINASKEHNYYAWSSYNQGIRIAARAPSSYWYQRSMCSGNWKLSQLSWWPARAGLGTTGADCAHPSLNTYSRLANEDSCALVWEEKYEHDPDTTIAYDNWHVYYTQLSLRGGNITHSLPKYKGVNPNVLDTNAAGNITRISKWCADARGYKEHHMPSVTRDLYTSSLSWIGDNILWAGQGDTTFWCTRPPLAAHGIFLMQMWTDNDTLLTRANNSILNCYLELNNPTMSWASSFTHDSDVVFDFHAPKYGGYGTDYIFHFAKSYWAFVDPMNTIEDGQNPQLSAQPFAGGNTQWKQVRRLYNTFEASHNPPIYSSVKAMFKSGAENSPITAYPLVGFENDGGQFTICDVIDDDHSFTMRALFHGVRTQYPSDTVYSDWFRVNDKKMLHFVMNGDYTNIAMMFLQNKRTGENTYVDLDQIVVDSSNAVQLGMFSVLNGGGDEYKVLLAKRDSSARYIEDVYIDDRLPFFAKGAYDSKAENPYRVDVASTTGLNSAQPLLAYPNPAGDEVYIAVAHRSREEEQSGSTMSVIVTNNRGEVIWRAETKGGETLKLSSAAHPNGVYNVQLITTNQENRQTSSSRRFLSCRFIIQH